MGRAAEELHTSQPAISRHITDIEARLGVTLFVRGKKQHRLTEQGEHFYRAVVSGLDNIQASINTISGWSTENYLTNEYHDNYASLDPRIDLAFSYKAADTETETTSIVFKEAVCPVCSPAFLEKHRQVLCGPISNWSELIFLQLTKPNEGWATWEDWFLRAGSPTAPLKYTRYDNYVYLLEAAAAGRGLALGWRGLIERYIDAGTLALVGQEFILTNNVLHAMLTPSGQTKPAAIKCLKYIASQST